MPIINIVNSRLNIIHILQLSNLKYQITTFPNFPVTIAQLNNHNKIYEIIIPNSINNYGSHGGREQLQDNVHDNLQPHGCRNLATILVQWSIVKNKHLLSYFTELTAISR